ncbi:hypothetical protein Vadar_019119 [Vaccinium darrowii]|uniref:Uncharacterized protein n=1 Tax=Vaccinium darrowii TaxID=229202 RepID=A0ACB7Z527_9ERIC|nr:hypothetical protein Vadar_019119 [Vaccinium darrowii]
MGPVKGFKKRRKVEPNVSASGSSKEGSLYWWDVFSKRIAGREGPYLPRLSLSLSQPPELYPEKQGSETRICNVECAPDGSNSVEVDGDLDMTV